MQPRFETIESKKPVGKHLKMSVANSKSSALWKAFGPKRKEITNNVTSDAFSITVYEPSFFKDFNPTNEFDRWAAVEVKDYTKVPDDLATFDLPGGLYAVFDYIGLSTDNSIYKYIFETWLPASEFQLDDRPHFEVLGDRYKNNDINSEEEIWVPVKRK